MEGHTNNPCGPFYSTYLVQSEVPGQYTQLYKPQLAPNPAQNAMPGAIMVQGHSAFVMGHGAPNVSARQATPSHYSGTLSPPSYPGYTYRQGWPGTAGDIAQSAANMSATHYQQQMFGYGTQASTAGMPAPFYSQQTPLVHPIQTWNPRTVYVPNMNLYTAGVSAQSAGVSATHLQQQVFTNPTNEAQVSGLQSTANMSAPVRPTPSPSQRGSGSHSADMSAGTRNSNAPGGGLQSAANMSAPAHAQSSPSEVAPGIQFGSVENFDHFREDYLNNLLKESQAKTKILGTPRSIQELNDLDSLITKNHNKVAAVGAMFNQPQPNPTPVPPRPPKVKPQGGTRSAEAPGLDTPEPNPIIEEGRKNIRKRKDSISSVSSMASSSKRHCERSEGPQAKALCPVCPTGEYAARSLKRHALMNHLPFFISPFTACFLCRVNLVTPQNLQEHMKVNHPSWTERLAGKKAIDCHMMSDTRVQTLYLQLCTGMINAAVQHSRFNSVDELFDHMKSESPRFLTGVSGSLTRIPTQLWNQLHREKHGVAVDEFSLQTFNPQWNRRPLRPVR